MMKISSDSSTNCFDFALDRLESFNQSFKYGYDFSFWELKVGISLLKTFDMYIRKCRRRRSSQDTRLENEMEDRGNAKSDSLRLSSISFKIQDLVRGIPVGLEYALSRCNDDQPDESDFSDIDIDCECARYEENMTCFFETDIKESGIIDLLLCYSLGDLQLVIDFIDSISENLKHLCKCYYGVDEALNTVMETLEEKLMFLKSFIRFATLQGVEGQQLKDLVVHVEAVALNAASLICGSWFKRNDKQAYKEMESEISQLIHKKIDSFDPQVRETYIHVLTASKLSRPSYTLAMKKNKHLVAEFIDYLMRSLMKLLESYPSFPVPVKDQMEKLHEGVRFLIILLSRQQEKFDELNDEMKNCIGFVVSDAGIVIFSLSVNEMKEGLCNETGLALSRLVEVLKLVIAEVGHIYALPSSSSLGFPRTNELGSLDFLLELSRN